MEHLWSHLQAWTIPVNESDKQTIMDCLTSMDNQWSVSLLEEYINRLQPYMPSLGWDKTRERDCLGSGLVFFYECLFFIMHYPNWGQYIEDIFLYNMLYLLVDHYMDDDEVCPQRKRLAVQQMSFLIEDPLSYRDMPLADPCLKDIALTYYELVTRRPPTLRSLRRLFAVQVETLTVQVDPTLDRVRYHQISLRKGGLTIEVLADIVGETNVLRKSAAYHLGTIMQLIDDSLDVLADKAKGFHTIATYDLKQNGNLDTLFQEIGWRILAIDSHFVLLKILYVIFICYLPGRMRSCYSDDIYYLTNAHNLFDFRYGCDGAALLTRAVASEIQTRLVLSSTK